MTGYKRIASPVTKWACLPNAIRWTDGPTKRRVIKEQFLLLPFFILWEKACGNKSFYSRLWCNQACIGVWATISTKRKNSSGGADW